jgi:hypothetical protein
MTGSLKIQNVTNWAGFWMRIDEKDSKFSLGFDNMKNGRKDRSVKGTIDWMKYEIILDVPKESYRIAYGNNARRDERRDYCESVATRSKADTRGHLP